MKSNRTQFLLKLLVDNKISAQELEELAELMEQPDSEELIDAQLKHTWDQEGSTNELSGNLYRKITEHPRFTAALAENKFLQPRRNRAVKRWYYAAASVLLCCSVGLGIYLYQFPSSGSNIIASHQSSVVGEIASGQESAHVTLKLSNGKQLILDQTAIGKVGQEENIAITKNEDKQLVYDLSKITDEGELSYNTISTPVGSHYQVVLSDGTKVWLNAKSTLRFPVVFKGNQRRVELSGEAYFEVAHNKKQPFMLTAKDMTVEVLGTHFNVSAYEDNEVVKTSLLEGAVRASYQKTSLLLKPGQQALLKNTLGTMSQRNFNLDEVMDWKNGYFIFRNEPIDEIMKKISRWYNIEVAYQGKLSREAFGGKYLKSNSLTELLSSLELTGTVKFKVQGRRVTVVQ